jgi:hypothetical protein
MHPSPAKSSQAVLGGVAAIPDNLAPHERIGALARLLAAGVLRLQRHRVTLKTTGDSAPQDLEVFRPTVLSVPRG